MDLKSRAKIIRLLEHSGPLEPGAKALYNHMCSMSLDKDIKGAVIDFGDDDGESTN